MPVDVHQLDPGLVAARERRVEGLCPGVAEPHHVPALKGRVKKKNGTAHAYAGGGMSGRQTDRERERERGERDRYRERERDREKEREREERKADEHTVRDVT